MSRSIEFALIAAVLAAMVVGRSAAQQRTAVTGRLTVLDTDQKQARDVGQAVVWLDAVTGDAVTPDTLQILMVEKEFRPRVAVVPVGSIVAFANGDPFNHNAFSLAPETPFDLGMYGRGHERAQLFAVAGIMRVYCNVHPGMIAFVVARDNPWFTRPAADGSFTIEDVPPGTYTLHAWHERAAVTQRTIEVSASGVNRVEIQLDARGYQWVQHMNKFGRPYRRGRRY